MSNVLHIEHASLAYENKFVFVDVNLTLKPGQWVALLGPSGVGKTSLLRMIAGLSTKGEEVHGHIIYPSPSATIAYMSQQDLLLPWLTVLQNTLLKTKLHAMSRQEKANQKSKALSLLNAVGLKEAVDLFPHQLSGGMRQRVALARTLMEDSAIILMDEPFSAVDAITRYKLQNLAAELLNQKTVLFITHDPQEALRLAHEIYIMQGSPAILRQVTQLQTETPRSLTDPMVAKSQVMLFNLLIQ